MLLRSDLPSDLFEDLDFAVFGLGDSSYEKFCWPAKLLARRLVSLGANEVCERGEGDEQHHLGIDGALISWLEKLSTSLLELFPLPSGVEVSLDGNSLPPPRVSMVPEVDASPNETNLFPPEYHFATLISNERTTSQDWYQDVRHIEFEFDQDISYEPGDVAVIHPEVGAAEVDSFIIDLGYANDADTLFRIQHTQPDQSLPDHMPTTLTLRQLFTRFLDITAIPRRSFFSYLRHFATNDLETEKIEEFLSEEGADDLYEYTTLVHRTIREVIADFRSVRIPKEYFFDVFPPLRPREFSIACSNLEHRRRIQLCVAIVQYRTKLKLPRMGVTTTYLASLSPGTRIMVGIKPGGLIRLPNDPSTPIICVGPGTGIAPIRSVLEQRIFQGSTENTLYQGCRSAQSDHHYKDQFEDYAKKDAMTYRVAFSRDGPPGEKRIYVQDMISQDSKRVSELLYEKDAWVIISGYA
ncbi:hypothetical protein NLI96_g10410 [Meripilus lineatus]|uniref:NADPH-dependent diflavin oxidoreductase 1 n=1 Tax=Meripilus lineatus TaxID=2056292 RepID=A0AAD5UV75_9APHY|nr:hypothetical protein NLI96_g10410 [Physisporinus lineatus]